VADKRPATLYLIALFAFPALIMVLASFRLPGDYGGLAPLFDGNGKPALSLDGYARFGREFIYTQLFIKSFWYALITTGVCLVMAYPLAMLIAGSPKKYRGLLVLLVILPFWSNCLIRVYADDHPRTPSPAKHQHLIGLFGAAPVPLLFSPSRYWWLDVHLPLAVLPLYESEARSALLMRAT
jgi:spermidine/putrescine transport system permease protein